MSHDHTWRDHFDDFQAVADKLERDIPAHVGDKPLQSEMKIKPEDLLASSDALYRALVEQVPFSTTSDREDSSFNRPTQTTSSS